MKRVKTLEMPQMNIIGKNIKEARLKSKLTQKQLSEKLETKAVYVCRGSISRIENGSRVVTDYEIKAISEILKVPIELLFILNEQK